MSKYLWRMTPCQKVAGLVTLSVMPIDASKVALERWMSGRVGAMMCSLRSKRVDAGGEFVLIMDELACLELQGVAVSCSKFLACRALDSE